MTGDGVMQVVETISGRLADGHYLVRTEAVTALAQLQLVSEKGVSEKVIAAILRLIANEENANARFEGVKVLGYLGKQGNAGGVVATVLERITDLDETVRMKAVEVLGQLAEEGNTTVIAALLDHGLADSNDKVRVEAIGSLVQLSYKNNSAVIAEIISRCLADESHLVRHKAVDGLVQLVGGGAHWHAGQGQARHAGKKTYPDVFFAILKLITKPNADSVASVRVAAMEALVWLAEKGDEEVILAILEQLEDGPATTVSWKVRLKAVEALVQLCVQNSPKVIAAILGLIKTPHDQNSGPVRFFAVRALGQLAENGKEYNKKQTRVSRYYSPTNQSYPRTRRKQSFRVTHS